MWQIVTNGERNSSKFHKRKRLTDAGAGREGTGFSGFLDPDGTSGKEEHKTQPPRCAGDGIFQPTSLRLAGSLPPLACQASSCHASQTEIFSLRQHSEFYFTIWISLAFSLTSAPEWDQEQLQVQSQEILYFFPVQGLLASIASGTLYVTDAWVPLQREF